MAPVNNALEKLWKLRKIMEKRQSEIKGAAVLKT